MADQGLDDIFNAGGPWVGIFELVLGALMGGGGVWIFARESKRWELRHLTTDRSVAGGFLIGFALILLGVRIGSHSGRAGSSVPRPQPRDLEAGFRAAGWLMGRASPT